MMPLCCQGDRSALHSYNVVSDCKNGKILKAMKIQFALNFTLPSLNDLESIEGDVWKYPNTFGWSMQGLFHAFELCVEIPNDNEINVRLEPVNDKHVPLVYAAHIVRQIKIDVQWNPKWSVLPNYNEQKLPFINGKASINPIDDVEIEECVLCYTFKKFCKNVLLGRRWQAAALHRDSSLNLPRLDAPDGLVAVAGESERCLCDKKTPKFLGKPCAIVFEIDTDTSTPFKCLQKELKHKRLTLLEDPCQIVQNLTLNMSSTGDAVLTCANEKAMRAASLLLRTRSKFFEASLKYSRVDEEDVTFRIDLHKFSEAVVNVIVVFICAGTIPEDLAELTDVDLHDVLELSAQADPPQSQIITLLVETELVGRGVTEDNVVALSNLTDLYELPTLRNICVGHLAAEPLRSFRAHKAPSLPCESREWLEW